jgi:hypothetical protein
MSITLPQLKAWKPERIHPLGRSRSLTDLSVEFRPLSRAAIEIQCRLQMTTTLLQSFALFSRALERSTSLPGLSVEFRPRSRVAVELEMTPPPCLAGSELITEVQESIAASHDGELHNECADISVLSSLSPAISAIGMHGSWWFSTESTCMSLPCTNRHPKSCS